MDVQETFMKRILLSSLLGLVLAGGAFAQQPMRDMPQGTPVSGPYAMPDPATGHNRATVHGDAGCCTPTQTVCVPEIAVRKVETFVYRKDCEPFCVPKCTCGMFGHHDCGSCPSCECPRTRYILVRKVCRCDEEYVKCNPVCVPACAPGCPAPLPGCATPVPGSVVPGTPAEQNPGRPLPK
jgi:hypothetical protein